MTRVILSLLAVFTFFTSPITLAEEQDQVAVTESHFDYRWVNFTTVEKIETVTEIEYVEKGAIKTKSVNQVRGAVTEDDYFFPLAFSYIILMLLASETVYCQSGNNYSELFALAAAFAAVIAVKLGNYLNFISWLIFIPMLLALGYTYISLFISNISKAKCKSVIHWGIVSMIIVMVTPFI